MIWYIPVGNICKENMVWENYESGNILNFFDFVKVTSKEVLQIFTNLCLSYRAVVQENVCGELKCKVFFSEAYLGSCQTNLKELYLENI